MTENEEPTLIRQIIEGTMTIAMVGASDNPERASYTVMQYLQTAGYRVIPVNPTALGKKILGETVYATLADIPHPFELVDVFRRVDAIPGIVDEIIPLIETRGIRYLWLQLGISDAASALKAKAAGLEVIMDHCLKVEHERLLA